MPSPEQASLVLILGAGDQLPHDLQHIYDSLDFAGKQNHFVEVESLWTPVPAIIEFTGSDPIVTQSLDEAKALEFADLAMERFDRLGDEDLLQWETEQKKSSNH